MPRKGELGQLANLSGEGGAAGWKKEQGGIFDGLILQCTQRNEIETYNSAISALSC